MRIYIYHLEDKSHYKENSSIKREFTENEGISKQNF